MDLEELDLQYSPRKWCKRFESERVVAEHIAIVTQASEEVKSSIPVQIGIPYGIREGEKLDIYGGDSLPKDAPILVYVHGGYWQFLDRSISCYCAKPLYAAGIRTVVVGYDLAPKVKVNDIIQEIRNAAHYILNMASNLGSKAVWFAGHSAGAHLCSTLLFAEWIETLNVDQKALLKGLILISGVFDLTPLIHTHVNGGLGMERNDAINVSPLFWDEIKNAENIKVILVVAEGDSPEFQRQSKDFHNKLLSKGIYSEYLLIPGVDHFDLVEKLNSDKYELTIKICNFLKM